MVTCRVVLGGEGGERRRREGRREEGGGKRRKEGKRRGEGKVVNACQNNKLHYSTWQYTSFSVQGAAHLSSVTGQSWERIKTVHGVILHDSHMRVM